MCESAVIGGGVLGLAVAQRLRQRGDHVTVFEAAPEIGGLAAAWQLGDIVWDRHYHVILASDRRTRDMLQSIDLEDDLVWVETKNGFFAGEETGMRPFSTAADFLRLPGMRLTDKVRLGTTILRGARINDGAAMERVHVERWLRKRSGDRAFEAFWVPLLRAKLGDAWTDTSAAFIWATIRRLYAARRSGLAKEQFGYVRGGGYARVFDRFAEVLRAEGVKLETAAPVRAVRPHDDRVRVELPEGSAVFDRVVVTTSAPLASRLCPDLTPEEHARLNDVRYMGVVCASVLLKRPLDGYYLTYITDTTSPFTAVVEMTAFVDPSEVAGHTLVYLPKYTAPDDRLFSATDDEVRAEFLLYLKRMYPRLVDDDVLSFQVSRVRQAFALPTLRYSSRMPATTTSIPSIQLLGSAELPFATLNVNDTLSLVRESPMTEPIASLSLDLDNLWSYQMTHGDPAWERYGSYLDVVVPLFLEELRRLSLRITVFVVGKDASLPSNEDALRSITDAGHEVGNHSFNHQPWLHRYSPEQLDTELTMAEQAIEAATGQLPRGFRGPGYSLSGELIEQLTARRYEYDCSTLPTVVGPLARKYYFRSANLDEAQRVERRYLFGSWRECLRPLQPYWWEAANGQLLEIPVSVMPFTRVPFHVSYVLYLAGRSTTAAVAYLTNTLRLCRIAGVQPSVLLHPLDFLGADDVDALEFFPGMTLTGAFKRGVVRSCLEVLSERYEVVTIGEHARQVRREVGLRTRPASSASPAHDTAERVA